MTMYHHNINLPVSRTSQCRDSKGFASTPEAWTDATPSKRLQDFRSPMSQFFDGPVQFPEMSPLSAYFDGPTTFFEGQTGPWRQGLGAPGQLPTLLQTQVGVSASSWTCPAEPAAPGVSAPTWSAATETAPTEPAHVPQWKLPAQVNQNFDPSLRTDATSSDQAAAASVEPVNAVQATSKRGASSRPSCPAAVYVDLSCLREK